MLYLLLLTLLLEPAAGRVAGGSCTVPDQPTNGFLDQIPASSIPVGARVTISCENSHYIDLTESPDYDYDDYDYDMDYTVTSYTRTCQDGGNLDGMAVTECKLYTCTQSSFENGFFLPNDTDGTFLVGDQVTLHCNDESVFGMGRGPGKKTCHMFSGWSDSTPNYCERVWCPNIVLDHGYWTPSQNLFYVGQKAKLECDEGYELYGPESLECTRYYGWNSTEIPVCRHKYTPVPEDGCQDPGTSPGAVLISSKDDLHIRHYECESPMHMNGNPKITCNRTSHHWSQRPPYCRSRHSFDRIPEIAYKISQDLEEMMSDRHENDVTARRHKRQFTDSYTGKKPLTLYLVVDQSGSISQKELDQALLFLKEIIHKLPLRELSDDGLRKVDGARIGLIGFADEAYTYFAPYENFNKTQMIEKIEAKVKKLDNATNIKDGLKEVVDSIDIGNSLQNKTHWMRHNRDANKAVIIITDGQYNKGGTPDEVVEKLREDYKCPIYVVGVSETNDKTPMFHLVDPKRRAAGKEDIYILKDYVGYVHLVEEMLGLGYNFTECGLSPVKPCGTQETQIKGGNKTKNEDFPWNIRIYVSHNAEEIIEGREPLPEIFGHGSLIGREWVLTAAHNGYEDEKKDGKDTGRVIERDRAKFIMEYGDDVSGGRAGVAALYDPGYFRDADASAGEKDIMLMKLDRSVTFSRSASPVCLPEPLKQFNQKFTANLHDAFNIAALGYVVGRGIKAKERHAACLPITNCTVQGKKHPSVTEEHFCAGQYGKDVTTMDTEDGDSGSAFTEHLEEEGDPKKKKHVAIGITSFGAMPKELKPKDGLGAYVKVPKFMEWIRCVIREDTVSSNVTCEDTVSSNVTCKG